MSINIERTEMATWEGLDITIHFKDELSEKENKEIIELLDAWYLIGSNGGYEGKLHYMTEVWVEEKCVGFQVDMGSTDKSAFDILSNSIEGFCEINKAIVEKIVLGLDYEE